MYSEALLDHFRHPRNVGPLEEANAEGRDGNPGQGNYIVLHLRISNGIIRDSRFQTYGCPGAIACGSYVAEWVVGKAVEEVGKLRPEDVDDAQGGLPLGKEHCAHLAVNALRDALACLITQEENDECPRTATNRWSSPAPDGGRFSAQPGRRGF